MKKLNMLFVIMLLPFLFGCKNSNPTVPQDIPVGNKVGLEIPVPEVLAGDSLHSSEQLIDGSLGGEITIDKSYPLKEGGEIKVIAKLKFQPESFKGQKMIRMVINTNKGTVKFTPALKFDKPGTLDIVFQGFNLAGIDPDEIDFEYFEPNGKFSPVIYKEIVVNKDTGLLKLVEGKIPHFSRYGYTKRYGLLNK